QFDKKRLRRIRNQIRNDFQYRPGQLVKAIKALNDIDVVPYAEMLRLAGHSPIFGWDYLAHQLGKWRKQPVESLSAGPAPIAPEPTPADLTDSIGMVPSPAQSRTESPTEELATAGICRGFRAGEPVRAGRPRGMIRFRIGAGKVVCPSKRPSFFPDGMNAVGRLSSRS